MTTPLPPTPQGSALVPLRVLAWLARDLLGAGLHLVLFLFTATHHRRALRDALAEVDR